MDYQPVSDKHRLQADPHVYPCLGTGTLAEHDRVVVRFTDKTGATQTVEGQLVDGEQQGRGHEFTITITTDADNTSIDPDADHVFVRTTGLDELTAPICTGDQFAHANILGYEADVFDSSQWADMHLGDRNAAYERRGEHATRPRRHGHRY